ncbi:FHA domain-containing protein [bacterium]|nr:FHA domain-containing protein [bacterium]
MLSLAQQGNLHLRTQHRLFMPIPPTLEIINPQDGSIVHEYHPPRDGSDSFYIGRNELISWFGDFPNSEKVSRKHIVIEAIDWKYGGGKIIIKDAGSTNGTVPHQISDSLIPHFDEGSSPCKPIEMSVAGQISIGFRYVVSMMTDIGHFGLHEEDPGIGFLQSELPNDVEAATALIQNLGASLTSGFLHIEDELLNHQERNKLISYTDAHFDGSPDFKLYLTPSELENLVGAARYEYLSSKMGNNFSEIVLRRVEDHGHAINFHTDYSHKTMQIMLSEQSDYDGCDLVFATGAGFEKPTRMPGQATIHDNSILHGVTEMKSGVRHSLFFLRNEVTF